MVDEGRRHRNMQLKRERIFTAAAQLFDERGYAGVTTQEVSRRAGIAEGTLFRYAASKSELLLMVYNTALQQSIAEGVANAAGIEDAAEAAFVMMRPIVERAVQDPENAAVYQRELLFGPPAERFRGEGLQLIRDIEHDLAQRIGKDLLGGPSDEIRLASAAIFAVTHFAIARMSTGAHPDEDAIDDLRGQTAQIVAGCGIRSG
ncbi:TetR/AcrR family transcriptional regulator [Corynebacterium terpenotabidum]|nr:TetR/AcrR family transcriptional regulator [Corynebacterium terpenotabidum]